MIVQGQSMLPTILPGSFIILQQAPPYEVGDIVAFNMVYGSSRKIVVHRIIEETDNGKWIMQGDNNEKRDAGYYTEEDVIGELRLAVPAVGDMLTYMRNPTVMVVLIVVAAAIQMEQNRRKKKNIKIRKIRRGIKEKPSILLEKPEIKKKPKKAGYTIFFAALGLNTITYLLTQISIAAGIKAQGDMLTGFLFNMFEQSNASTIAFGFYFVMITGAYFLAKSTQTKKEWAEYKYQQKNIVPKKGATPVHTIAQIVLILYLLMGSFHIITIWGDFATIIN